MVEFPIWTPVESCGEWGAFVLLCSVEPLNYQDEEKPPSFIIGGTLFDEKYFYNSATSSCGPSSVHIVCNFNGHTSQVFTEGKVLL